MKGLLRHSTLLGSQLREDGSVLAPGFLQNPAVRNWLGGIVPAWTMLGQKSFEALRLPPLPPVGAIRFAVDFSPEDIGQSAVARNALILLHSASVGLGLKLTTTGNLERSVVAEMRDLFTWPGFDKTEAFQFHKVINEPDFLPLYFVRHLVETAGLVRQRKGYLKTTPAGRQVHEDPARQALQALLFHLGLWGIYLGYFGRGLHREWPQRDIGVLLWSLSVAANGWESSKRRTDQESLPDRIDLEAYRAILQKEAIRLLRLPRSTLPWYLKQQILLFLAAASHQPINVRPSWISPETRNYCDLLRFLGGRFSSFTNTDFAILSITARRSILDKNSTIRLIRRQLNGSRLRRIARRDVGFAIELLQSKRQLTRELSPRLREDLCVDRAVVSGGEQSLASITIGAKGLGPLAAMRMLHTTKHTRDRSSTYMVSPKLPLHFWKLIRSVNSYTGKETQKNRTKTQPE